MSLEDIGRIVEAFGPTFGVIIIGLVAAIIYLVRRNEKLQEDNDNRLLLANQRYVDLLERFLTATATSNKVQADLHSAIVDLKETLKIYERIVSTISRVPEK